MDTYLQGNLGKKNHSGEVGTKSEARLGWAGRLLRTRLPIGRACCQDLGQLTEPPTARKAAKTLCKFLCTSGMPAFSATHPPPATRFWTTPTRPANDAISWQHRDTWPPAAFSSSSIASPCILRDISRVPASPPRGQRCRDRLAPVSDLQRPSPPIPCVDPCPARTAAMSAALCRSLLEVLTEPS